MGFMSEHIEAIEEKIEYFDELRKYLWEILDKRKIIE